MSVDGLVKRFPIRRAFVDMVRRPRGGGSVTSLNAISFSVNAGEFFGLLGPNGAGKTTLLKILATFITPDEGVAVVDGVDVLADPARVRALVAPVIASERSLYWRLTARENLELFGTLWRVPPDELTARVARVLEVVKLHDTGTKLVGQFSSGMMQRLLIARALLAEPKVLLLDEPTRSLDPVSARDFRHFLRDELATRRQCAVILATHSPDEAFELCDRVAVLSKGQIVAQGKAAALMQEVGEPGYVLWTRTPQHALLLSVGAAPLALDRNAKSDSEARSFFIPLGARNDAGQLVRQLVAEGVDVVEFRPHRASLAALIEHAITRGPVRTT